ncbi:MAG: hypothetical protein ACKVT0_14685 [Planctomycetaceae bacterium]
MSDTVEKDLVQFLLDTAEIAALVGAKVHYGFFPPENDDLPAIVISCLGGGDGFNTPEINGGSSMLGTRFEIKCIADDFMQAIDISKVVELRCNGFNGELNGDGSTQATLQLEDRADNPVPLSDGSGQYIPARSVIISASFTIDV